MSTVIVLRSYIPSLLVIIITVVLIKQMLHLSGMVLDGYSINLITGEMKQNTKDWIQYSTATAMVVSAIVIAFVALVLTSTIASGVLIYIA